jgi:hypothetical protein
MMAIKKVKTVVGVTASRPRYAGMAWWIPTKKILPKMKFVTMEIRRQMTRVPPTVSRIKTAETAF